MELSSQLHVEFYDPEAIQPGDTYDDALDRGVHEGITITKCRLSKADTQARIKVTWYQTQAKVQLRTGDNVVVTLAEGGAEREDLEFIIIEMDSQNRSMDIDLQVVEDGLCLGEQNQRVKVLCENDS